MAGTLTAAPVHGRTPVLPRSAHWSLSAPDLAVRGAFLHRVEGVATPLGRAVWVIAPGPQPTVGWHVGAASTDGRT